jgi:hypothetical protein
MVEESFDGGQGIVISIGFLGQSAMAGPATAYPRINKTNIPMNKNRFILHLPNVNPDHAVSEKTVGFDQVIKENKIRLSCSNQTQQVRPPNSKPGSK